MLFRSLELEGAEVWPFAVTVEVTTSPGFRFIPPHDQIPPLTVAAGVQTTGTPFTSTVTLDPSGAPDVPLTVTPVPVTIGPFSVGAEGVTMIGVDAADCVAPVPVVAVMDSPPVSPVTPLSVQAPPVTVVVPIGTPLL